MSQLVKGISRVPQWLNWISARKLTIQTLFFNKNISKRKGKSEHFSITAGITTESEEAGLYSS